MKPASKPSAYDLVIIGAGEAGQAAAHLARKLGGTVAIIDRELFGGSCPHWACMPSKALLHAASIHHLGGDYPWRRASDFRDWMINRENRDWPDDSGHVRDLEAAGAVDIRGEARMDGPGRVVVRTAADEHTLTAHSILVAVGTNASVPDDIEGLDQIRPWTNLRRRRPGSCRRASSSWARDRPGSRCPRSSIGSITSTLCVCRGCQRGCQTAMRRPLGARLGVLSERETAVSRLGFEPRTRGSKVSREGVHRVHFARAPRPSVPPRRTHSHRRGCQRGCQ